MSDTGSKARTNGGHDGRALVALFADRDAAHSAIHQLHDEGFHRTWLGITRAAREPLGDASQLEPDVARSSAQTITSESDEMIVVTDAETLGDKIGRFFSGASRERGLYGELVRHGVPREDARSIESEIPVDAAILTVDGLNHPEAAAAIVEQRGGHIIAGEAFDDETGAVAGDELRRGSDVLGYRDPQRYARGRSIDDRQRIELRSERLNLERRREPIGEATLGKEVTEHRHEIDVPVVREELFIERKPATTPTPVPVTDATIGADRDSIRIPLMRERVVVTKRPVIASEVVAGKRPITETEHVSETTREERLRVDDAPGDATGR